jgi:glutaredoxin
MGDEVILYEHGCPNCLRLKKKLDEKNIKYKDVTDKQLMLSLGFEEAPKLSVNGVVMGFKEAIKWIGEQ